MASLLLDETPEQVVPTGTEGLTQDPLIQPQGQPFITPESKVSNQLSTLLGSDSPYIQRAQSLAKEDAQRSGLLSSSMAAGAGVGAAIDRGLPIASQDAEALTRSGLLAQEGSIASQLGQEKASQNIAQVTKEAELTGGLEEAKDLRTLDRLEQQNLYDEQARAETLANEITVMREAGDLNEARAAEDHTRALEIMSSNQENLKEHTTLQGMINANITAMQLDQVTGTNYADGVMKIMTLDNATDDIKTQMVDSWYNMYQDIGSFSSSVANMFGGNAVDSLNVTDPETGETINIGPAPGTTPQTPTNPTEPAPTYESLTPGEGVDIGDSPSFIDAWADYINKTPSWQAQNADGEVFRTDIGNLVNSVMDGTGTVEGVIDGIYRYFKSNGSDDATARTWADNMIREMGLDTWVAQNQTQAPDVTTRYTAAELSAAMGAGGTMVSDLLSIIEGDLNGAQSTAPENYISHLVSDWGFPRDQAEAIIGYLGG